MKNDFAKVVSAEIFKLVRQRSTLGVCGLVIVFAIVMFIVAEFAARRDWIGVPSGHFVAASVIAWLTSLMAVLAVVVTSFLISQEFALGTIKSTWVRPVSRSRWYAAKVVMAAGVVSDLFVFAVVLTVVLSAARLGFTDLTERTYVIHTAGALTWRLVLTVALTVWALWAVAAFVAMIAGLFRHPGGAITVTLVAGMAMTVLAAFPPLRPFLLSSQLTMPVEQMVAMTKGLPLPLEWNDLVWRTLAGAGAWMLVSLLVGVRVIRSKEITT